MSRLSTARVKLSELEKELSKYGSCDPAKIEAKRRASTLAHEAAIRWTGTHLLSFVFLYLTYLKTGLMSHYLAIPSSTYVPSNMDPRTTNR